MVNLTVDRLKDLGFDVVVNTADIINDPEGLRLKIPPIVFATLGNDPEKNTLLIYGHLDVQPAKKVCHSEHCMLASRKTALCYFNSVCTLGWWNDKIK